MNKRVIYFRKNPRDVIQGVCQGDTMYISVGHPCNVSTLHGGGFVESMQLRDDGLMEIRKVNAEGKHHRDFGEVSQSTRGGSRKIKLVADGVMVPAGKLDSIVFCDEEDGAQAVDPPPAKPIDKQQGQRR